MTPPPPEPVSVVIPTLGRVELLAETLPILLADDATMEVVLVPHDAAAAGALGGLGGGDGRVRIEPPVPARDLQAEQRGRDLGALRARAELILCLDDDVVPRPGLVTGHALRHAGEDRLVVLGYMPVSVPRPGGRERLYARGYERMCRLYEAEPATVIRNLWGGNLSLRRRHWLQAREARRVPMRYHADRELGLVLMGLGLRALFDRRLLAEHRYRRAPASIAREAAASALDTLELSRAYPDLVPPPSPSRHRALRGVARAGRRPRLHGALQRSLLTSGRVAALLRAHGVEDALMSTLWRVSFDRELRP